MSKLIEDYLARGGQVHVCPSRLAHGVPSRPIPRLMFPRRRDD